MYMCFVLASREIRTELNLRSYAAKLARSNTVHLVPDSLNFLAELPPVGELETTLA